MRVCHGGRQGGLPGVELDPVGAREQLCGPTGDERALESLLSGHAHVA